MKFVLAEFCFDDGSTVRFDAPSKTITVDCDGKATMVKNANGAYRPCVTHAIDLVREQRQKPPASEHARQRREEARAAKRKGLNVFQAW